MGLAVPLLVGSLLLSLPSGIMSCLLLMALLDHDNGGRHSPKELSMSPDLIARYRKGILCAVGFASELIALGVLHGWPLWIAQAGIAGAASAGVVLVPNKAPVNYQGMTPEQAVAQWNDHLSGGTS